MLDASPSVQTPDEILVRRAGSGTLAHAKNCFSVTGKMPTGWLTAS